VTAEHSDDDALALLQAQLSRAFEARDAGRSTEALELWDQLLARDINGLGQGIELAMAQVAYAKAHLLLELGRAAEAETAAREAVDLAAAMSGVEAQVLAADALGTRRAALTALDRFQDAVEIDERLARDFADSDSFELRLCAARAMHHEIWIRMREKEPARAILAARRIVEVLRGDADSERLIEVGELILSGAETLYQQKVWRRGPADLRGQAQVMRDAVLDMADHVGGDIGAAVTLNARLALGNASARDLRLVTAVKQGLDRPSLDESVLPALERVERTAQQAGAQTRYLDLVIERAGVLDRVGRSDEALQLLDNLLDRLDADGDKAGVLAIRAMRSLFAS
jgi:tetratricopeptide (TPR) repeat protein